jgi:hypothetical protein
MIRPRIIAVTLCLSLLLLFSACESLTALDKSIARAISNSANTAETTMPKIRPDMNANLRAEPSMQAEILNSIPAGTEIPKIGEEGNWIKTDVELTDGSHLVGWVNKEMLDK